MHKFICIHLTNNSYEIVHCWTVLWSSHGEGEAWLENDLMALKVPHMDTYRQEMAYIPFFFYLESMYRHTKWLSHYSDTLHASIWM